VIREDRDNKYSLLIIAVILTLAVGLFLFVPAIGGTSGGNISMKTDRNQQENKSVKGQVTPDNPGTKIAVFGAGCFWGVEAAFRRLPGVLATEVGYSGGNFKNPTYHDVCGDRTGHAEVVRVEFDPQKITYRDLLRVFWLNHDPTTKNRQGPDIGTQYRSVIFYFDEGQRQEALASLQEEEKSGRYSRPLVTEIVPAKEFYRAEEYHQQYLEKRGQASCHL